MSLNIARSLQDKEVLLTGATGFLGLALVEKLLRDVPGCRLTLLVRSVDHAAAQQRFLNLVGDDDLFAGLPAGAMAHISCLAGDITAPGLGLSDAERRALHGRFALVINCAASVDFDEPVDEAISINIEGPLAVQALASEIGADLLQISTAYVCGMRSGAIPDSFETAVPFPGCVTPADADAELEALKALVQQIYSEHGRTTEKPGNGGKKLLMALMAAGRDYANARGWTDIYTYTKYLSEQLLVRRRGDHALGIFRPAIIESAAGGQRPGWLRGVKVMDMILAAYGKGIIHGFPVDLDAPLDVIPVDMVANAVLAQAAQMLSERRPDAINVCQLGTSASNPLLLKKVSEYTYAHYKANPLPDAAGNPIIVRKPRFPLLKNHVQWLERYLRLLNMVGGLLNLPLVAPPAASLRRRLIGRQKDIKRYLSLAKMFGSYAQTRRQFMTTNADALYLRLSQEEQTLFNFSHHSIDWKHYMLDNHLPGLHRLLVTGKSQ